MNSSRLQHEIEFVEQWLNHFNITYNKDVSLQSNNLNLDFVLHNSGIGIFFSDWKKPISVLIINHTLELVKHFHLDEILIIAESISEHAQDVIERFQYPISFVHKTDLSSLAMKFVEISKINFVTA